MDVSPEIRAETVSAGREFATRLVLQMLVVAEAQRRGDVNSEVAQMRETARLLAKQAMEQADLQPWKDLFLSGANDLLDSIFVTDA